MVACGADDDGGTGDGGTSDGDGGITPTPHLAVTCTPAGGDLTVGQSITATAVVTPASLAANLRWVQVSNGGSFVLPGNPGTAETPLTAEAASVGAARIALEWTGPIETTPIFGATDVTTCDFSIQAAGVLTVVVRRTGQVTGSPGAISCAQANFDPGVTAACAVSITGQVSLLAAPDGSFGFTGTRWYGCDAPSGNACTTTVTGATRVEACFHDGSAQGLMICDDAPR